MEMAIKRGGDSEREMVEERGGRGRDRSRDRDREFATERKRGGGEREGWWRDREGLGGGGERELEKDSSIRSIWTYPTAGPCYTTSTNKHNYTTNRYCKHENATD